MYCIFNYLQIVNIIYLNGINLSPIHDCLKIQYVNFVVFMVTYDRHHDKYR